MEEYSQVASSETRLIHRNQNRVHHHGGTLSLLLRLRPGSIVRHRGAELQQNESEIQIDIASEKVALQT